MNAIRIRKKLDSETLSLPELRPLVGQTVEIIVLTEETFSAIRPGTGDWKAFDRLSREMTNYDIRCPSGTRSGRPTDDVRPLMPTVRHFLSMESTNHPGAARVCSGNPLCCG